jgi:hypothetical protein
MEKFILTQVAMLSNGYSEEQVKDNVYRHVFTNGIPNRQINATDKGLHGVVRHNLLKYALQEINPNKND